MSIKKLDEFAINGDKSINGLTLTTGFPRQQKPYRQWMNYLFNMVTAKTNQLVDAVNVLDIKIEPLLKPIAIGEVFITTASYTAAEVAERHGYGTWQRFAEGKTLVGYSSKTSDLDDYRIMGNEFGANTHQLSLSEMPEHKHSDSDKFKYFTARHFKSESITAGDFVQTNMEWQNHQITESEFAQALEKTRGSSQPHNNIQPSIVVAYWLRVA